MECQFVPFPENDREAKTELALAIANGTSVAAWACGIRGSDGASPSSGPAQHLSIHAVVIQYAQTI